MQIRVRQGGGRNARFGRKSITRRENTLHISYTQFAKPLSTILPYSIIPRQITARGNLRSAFRCYPPPRHTHKFRSQFAHYEIQSSRLIFDAFAPSSQNIRMIKRKRVLSLVLPVRDSALYPEK